MNEQVVPAGFDVTFLRWLRERTQQAWANYRTRPFSAYEAAGVGGRDWKQGSRWSPGLSHAQIDQVETEWSVRFPPDYRLFLNELHSIDRPMSGAKFVDGNKLVPRKEPSFYNWLTDKDSLQWAFQWPLKGLRFDVERNDLWLPSWGEKPEAIDERKRRLQDLVDRAPRLIPVFGSAYLLAEPCQEGNPVFDVWQDDITLAGPNLRQYLLTELSDLVGIDRARIDAEGVKESTRRFEEIPFWGELYIRNND